MSSKRLTLDLTCSARSLMYARKRIGLRTELCGSSEETRMLSGFSPLITTACFQLSYKVLDPFQGVSSNAIMVQFKNKFFMATQSKALLKSNKIKSVCLSMCMVLDNWSISMISCILQDLFSQKPCWGTKSMFSSVKCLEWLEATMCSSTLQRTQISEMGLQLEGSALSPFLKIRDSFASFQMCGSFPVSKDFSKITCRMGDNSLFKVLICQGLQPFGGSSF